MINLTWLSLVLIVIVVVIIVLVVVWTANGVKSFLGKFPGRVITTVKWVFGKGWRKPKSSKDSFRIRLAKRKNRKLRIKKYKEYVETKAIYTTEFVNSDPRVDVSEKHIDYLVKKQAEKRK